MAVANPVSRSTGTRYSAGTPAAKTSATFTPTAGALLIAVTYIAENANSRSYTITSTLNAVAPDGGGTVWVKKVSQTVTLEGFPGEFAIWCAKAPASPNSGAITATPSGSHTGDGWNWVDFLEVPTGVDFSTFGSWATGTETRTSTASTGTVTLASSPAAGSLYLSATNAWDLGSSATSKPTSWSDIPVSTSHDYDGSWLNEIYLAYRNGTSGSPHSWAFSPSAMGMSAALEVKASGAGVPMLVVANVAQAQTIEAPALTQHQVLTGVANVAQAQAINAPALTQHQVLTGVANVAQAQAIDNITLTPHATGTVLIVANVAQAQSIGAPALTQHQVLAVDNVSQLQAINSFGLTQHQVLALANVNQAQALDNITLTPHAPSWTLVVANVAQAQAIATMGLTQHQRLVVANVAQAQALGSPSFVVRSLAVANVAQGQFPDNVVLVGKTAAGVVIPANVPPVYGQSGYTPPTEPNTRRQSFELMRQDDAEANSIAAEQVRLTALETRIAADEVEYRKKAQGVLARNYYGTADQTVTVAAGAVALAGGGVTATVAPSRYSRLCVQFYVAPSAGTAGTVRIVHSWNGIGQYTHDLAFANWVGFIASCYTPPFGLAAGTYAYNCTIQAFTTGVVVLHNSFQATYYWVEDLGG